MTSADLHVTSDDLHVASVECTRPEDPHSTSYGLHACDGRPEVAMTEGLTEGDENDLTTQGPRLTVHDNILLTLPVFYSVNFVALRYIQIDSC